MKTSILIPCYNEEKTIADTVSDFKKYMPTSDIYVYDNNSSDNSINEAKKVGAIVRTENRQGKGFVVARMFADIDSDIYILVDGDNTYDASNSQTILNKLINENLDYINCARISNEIEAYRKGHRLGNYILTGVVKNIFGGSFNDMLSGYKFMSKRFVKTFPVSSKGFEIETELMVHALELRVPYAEVSVSYRSRPDNSLSKLNTYKDGLRILLMIFSLIRNEKPLQFFGSLGFLSALLSIAITLPILDNYLQTGLVPRIPTIVLSSGMFLAGVFCFGIALVLDGVSSVRREQKKLAYLSLNN